MSIASVFGLPQAYYGPGGPGETVPCRDCGQPADRDMGGDHGGECLDHLHVIPPNSGLGIIRRYARTHPGCRFSMNTLRAEFDKAGIKESSRGPAFGVAKRQGLIERDGYEPSLDGPTKGAMVATYIAASAPGASYLTEVGA